MMWGKAPQWGKGGAAAGGAWGGGGGGGGYGGKGNWPKAQKPQFSWAVNGDNTEAVWTMISETVASFAHLETDWDADKLEKKIREYFNKASKNLNTRGRPLQEAVDEYADNAMGSIFAGLGDREWLYMGQADFTLVLDAGIKNVFPANVLNTVSQEDFEQMVLLSHGRAFEEQRFGPILSESVAEAVSGPKIKKKVWNAMDHGRKEAVNSGAATLDDFVNHWIATAITQLSEVTGGAPDSVLEPEAATGLFHSMLQKGALPIAMTNETGPPPEGWPLVDEAVTNAYSSIAEMPVPEMPTKKKKAW